MTIDVRPSHDRVIVRPVDECELVRDGKLTPETAKDKSHEGVVIAAGDGKYRADGSRVGLEVTGNAGVLGCTDTKRVLVGTRAGDDTLDPRKIEGEALLNIREDARNDHTRGRLLVPASG